MTTYTLEQQKEHRKLWVEALRSGEYQQAREMLHDGGGFCCLGVACVVAGKTTAEIGTESNLSQFDDVMNFFGLADDEGRYSRHHDNATFLARDNDDGLSFSEIADIIESEPPGLFVESVQP